MIIESYSGKDRSPAISGLELVREARGWPKSRVLRIKRAPGGKPGPDAPYGKHGINDYTAWFAGDDTMRGDYFGYDGPCPPWNDELVHRYVFTLYALDIVGCVPEGRFGGNELRNAIAGHILAEAKLTGTYTLNPAAAE